ncbi:MAG TPA: hypothetical protein DCZ95_16725 [Verrucomicrobia bacterium]|nr:MAG: hypothetical protein A2X46_03715 [Lentisphaerae bacterium GWF2_57_35]HBA85728.1 hypothetical protein [Verrucomicrobiota bacterium]
MKNPTIDQPACLFAVDVPAYLRGQLSPEEKTSFERHVQECSTCRGYVEDFKPLLNELSQPPANSPSRDLAPDILARIPTEAWKKPRLIYFATLLRIAALFLCLLAGGYGLIAHHRTAGAATAPENKRFLQAALTWLLKTQEADGRWEAAKWGAQKHYTVGITALALIACLKTDSDILYGPQASAVENGLRYLIAQQNTEGRLGSLNSGTPYNHGLGTLALLEAFEVQDRPEWKEAIGRALAYIRTTQRTSGAWGYPREPDAAGNTSITAWQIQALLKAAELGWDTRPQIDRALAWLDGMSDPSGRIGYSRRNEYPNGHETLTAAGAWCLLNSRPETTPDRLSRILNAVHTVAQSTDQVDYYRCYFLTRALQAEGSRQAAVLKTRIQQLLLARQTRSGEHTGSCEPTDSWSSAGGRVYTTAMAVLALQ